MGLGDDAMVNADGSVAYPLVGDIPVLLSTEAYGRGRPERVEVSSPHFAEAYAEAALYGAVASAQVLDLDRVPAVSHLERVAGAVDAGRLDPASFPEPPLDWLASGSTITAQHECFTHLAPVEGAVVLQIGGTGSHALLFLLGGAVQAYLVSPIVEELRLASAIAAKLGFTDRFRAVGGIAEELPLPDDGADVVFSGSSIHHTVTRDAFREVARVLTPNGRFASVDVRDAPLHGLGTKVFGRQGGNVHCRPLDPDRIAPLVRWFEDTSVSFHGAVARYPLAVMARLGRRPGAATSWRPASAEDRLAARVAPLRAQSSLVCLIAAGPRRPDA